MQLQTSQEENAGRSFRQDPVSWLRENNLSRGFWIYFAATLFFDAGFCIYFFIFNLYLFDLHFNERIIGIISGASTLGSVLIMLPAGVLSKRIGVRALMILCYVLSPLFCLARALWIWPPAQIGLALLGGMAISSGVVCYLPTVARLTTEKNRTAAFSLIFSASLASSAIGGVICGYLPHWFELAGLAMPAVQIKRLILLVSCGVALLAVIPAAILRIPKAEGEKDIAPVKTVRWQSLKVSPSLFRILVPMSLWAAVLAAFFPFGNVFLAADLHLPMDQIGIVFSTIQVLQLCMIALTPVLFRLLGLPNGLLAIQVATGLALGVLALTQYRMAAIGLFLLFTALQWMANPGLYDVLMSRTPDRERDSAAAVMLFCNAVISTLVTPCAGMLYARYGYRAPMIGIAAFAVIVAALSRLLFATSPRSQTLSQQKMEHPEFSERQSR